MNDCLLTILPAANPDERLAVYLIREEDGASKLSLRQQNWAQGIGWYDQKTMDLDPEQFRQLRSVGAPVASKRRVAAEAPATIPFPTTAACG